MGERGREAVSMIPRLLGGLKTHVHLERVPTFLPLCMMCTSAPFPAAEMNELCWSMEKTPGVLDCSVFHGFPYADISIAGTRVIVTTDNDPQLARQVARQVGAWIWNNRDRFRHRATSSVMAVAQVKEATTGPVCVNETADNTGCGAPGDGTHLLHAILRADFQAGEACFGWIYDPVCVRQAIDAGVGANIKVALGGKLDVGVAGVPVQALAHVVGLNNGRHTAVPGSAYDGIERDMGTTAHLLIHNVDVLVVSKRVQCFDEGLFTKCGINISKYKIVGIKSSTHFRAGWEPISTQIITADDPGLSSNALEVFEPLRSNKLAYWPINAEAEYAGNQQSKL